MGGCAHVSAGSATRMEFVNPLLSLVVSQAAKPSTASSVASLAMTLTRA